MEKISLKTNRRTELIEITDTVQRIIYRTGIKRGICFVFCPHTTAGLTINENADSSVRKDIVSTLSNLIPEGADYAHAEGNAAGHIKSSLFGSSLVIFIEEGVLALGRWQGIYFCEGDGPRSREVWVRV
ncbi:MAG: secondary thiamine-phosphate synthase enzyme YjbQ, partial [Candidatus Omnitrophica bacterium]|nr:secondary thiamine-phosphate synthase enzyme YjbQ [Candidatus Omnitrophota bacterium]